MPGKPTALSSPSAVSQPGLSPNDLPDKTIKEACATRWRLKGCGKISWVTTEIPTTSRPVRPSPPSSRDPARSDWKSDRRDGACCLA